MTPLPRNDPAQQILPAGTFMVTEDLIQMLAKIPDAFTPSGRPLAFPTREGPWLFLPHGSILTIREDQEGERLTAVHHGDPGTLYDKDREILHRYLD